MEIANPYYLVKVTDKKWADKLMNGEVFMRPLSDFGDMMSRPTESNNEFRGDTLEGLTDSFGLNGEKSQFFTNAFDGNLAGASGTGQISQAMLQDRIIFSLFCLEYSEARSDFVAPTGSLLQFGDTAVVILDPKQFIYRICEGLFLQFSESYWLGAMRVSYNADLSAHVEYDGFSKVKSYSWQNEFRVAVDISEGKVDQSTWESMTDFARLMFLNQGGRVDTTIDRKPLIVDAGDLRDICVDISTTDLISLKLPLQRLVDPPYHLSPFLPPRKSSVTPYKPVIQTQRPTAYHKIEAVDASAAKEASKGEVRKDEILAHLGLLAMQNCMEWKLDSVAGSEIYHVPPASWQAGELSKSNVVCTVHDAIAFEQAVRKPDVRAIFIPNAADLTQGIAVSILQRNPLPKHVFWEAQNEVSDAKPSRESDPEAR